jgi:hypothetical protein
MGYCNTIAISLSTQIPRGTVILDELHSNPATGHSGYLKAVQRVNKLFY